MEPNGECVPECKWKGKFHTERKRNSRLFSEIKKISRVNELLRNEINKLNEERI